MRRVEDITDVNGTTLDEIHQKRRQLLDEGWEPVGAVKLDEVTGRMQQGMVLYREVKGEA